MSGLPSGWIEVQLGEVADWGSGGTPKADIADYYGGGIPWAVIGDLNDGPVGATTRTITDAGLSNSSAKMVDDHTVLVAMYGSIGKLGLPIIPMATNQAIAFARPKRDVVNRLYLFYYLMHARRALATAGKGATQQNISQTVLKAWPIPLAPPAEQERIVAVIEEQFSRLDAGAAVLERVRLNLKWMRTAVQHQAINGIAMREYDRSPFGEVLCQPLRNGHSAKADPLGTVPVFTLTAVTLGDFSDRNIKMTAADPRRILDLWVQPGDILIERSNTKELVGTARLYRGPSNVAIYPDLVIRARVNDTVLPEYAELVLQSPESRRHFQQHAQGISGTMPKIDQGVIERLPFPVPARGVQAAIVADTERCMTMFNVLEGEMALAESRARSLRFSILDAAFSGKLVPQNPGDESALVLRKRIAAERTSTNSHKLVEVRRQRGAKATA
ncbi:MAG TPA: restriction endonuclease subunit S [Solirubrobacteraceae bacterium]|nr:restriction endonuclease subunit S [Solirubrobacteraceae bacterium]